MGNKLLLVEDETGPLGEEVKVFIRQLNRAGYAVEVAETGLRAVNFLKNKPFDLVILDIMLDPGSTDEDLIPKGLDNYMGGVRILEKIVGGDFEINGQHLPVIVITAVALAEVQERVKTLLGDKANDRYFLKPVKIKKLLSAINKATGNNS